VLGVCLLIAMLGAVGLPGLNGFVGEFTILTGVFQINRWYAAVATLGVVLSAWYMLWTFQRVMHGKVTDPRNEETPDVQGNELLVLVPLLVLIFVLGIMPNLILGPASESVAALAQKVVVLLPQIAL